MLFFYLSDTLNSDGLCCSRIILSSKYAVPTFSRFAFNVHSGPPSIIEDGLVESI